MFMSGEKYLNAMGLVEDLAAWLRATRTLLDSATGLSVYAGPAILAVLTEMEADKGCVEDLGAVNRWPERSNVPLENYLQRWRMSCAQIAAQELRPAWHLNRRTLLNSCGALAWAGFCKARSMPPQPGRARRRSWDHLSSVAEV